MSGFRFHVMIKHDITLNMHMRAHTLAQPSMLVMAAGNSPSFLASEVPFLDGCCSTAVCENWQCYCTAHAELLSREQWPVLCNTESGQCQWVAVPSPTGDSNC
eukprot:scpid23144/ scgid27073/ 